MRKYKESQMYSNEKGEFFGIISGYYANKKFEIEFHDDDDFRNIQGNFTKYEEEQICSKIVKELYNGLNRKSHVRNKDGKILGYVERGFSDEYASYINLTPNEIEEDYCQIGEHETIKQGKKAIRNCNLQELLRELEEEFGEEEC